MLKVTAHPLLDCRSFVTTFPKPLGEMQSGPELLAMLDRDAQTLFSSSDEIRKAVRDLLRQGGFKPTGRSKPASEYLIKASGEQPLSPINLAVDVCNLVSLHSGLPISVVDLDLVTEPVEILVAPEGAEYVFNRSGQTLDIGGLLCLADAKGPCANAVKDSQRTKTHADTRRTLSIIWGTVVLQGRTQSVESWYRQLLESQGAVTTDGKPTDENKITNQS
ncbi:B3/4 domain protein [Rubripirellula amarantea]|uniref:B3/4 domain protein n=1 Tax=Rubripirellula amarantea TaxID=2527999 RepID=A0A5C5WJR1_9BACT|nr:phenylalanine--tRNA ligase beta subunit-related protein [Rubripirellula amarantea]TWT50203.1 B3/4 domain protein [Rubripirellula amarantea]